LSTYCFVPGWPKLNDILPLRKWLDLEEAFYPMVRLDELNHIVAQKILSLFYPQNWNPSVPLVQSVDRIPFRINHYPVVKSY